MISVQGKGTNIENKIKEVQRMHEEYVVLFGITVARSIIGYIALLAHVPWSFHFEYVAERLVEERQNCLVRNFVYLALIFAKPFSKGMLYLEIPEILGVFEAIHFPPETLLLIAKVALIIVLVLLMVVVRWLSSAQKEANAKDTKKTE